MKCVIRKGVFETNSSSTHSVTYGKKPREYTYELASAWSRLYMLKALLNATNEPWRHIPWDSDAEAYGSADEAAEAFDEAAEGMGELDEYEEYEPKAEDGPSALQQLYDACVKVFCDTEGIAPEDLQNYLADKAVDNICDIPNKARFREYFLNNFDDPSCNLCSCIFSEGTLDECTCGYDSCRLANELFMDFIDCIENRYAAMAREYLYGRREMYVTEHYAGCKTIDAKRKV